MWQPSPNPYLKLVAETVSSITPPTRGRSRPAANEVGFSLDDANEIGLAAEGERELDEARRQLAVARKIAHCLTTRELARTGLPAVCQALECQNAALWLVSGGTRPRLLASRGTTAALRRRLRSALAAWQSGSLVDPAAGRPGRRADSASPDAVTAGSALGSSRPAVWECATRGPADPPDGAGHPASTDLARTHPAHGGHLRQAGDPDGSGEPGAGDLMIVPLVLQETSFGALGLLSAGQGCWTDERRLCLAQAIAAQLAVALHKAGRYEEAHFLAERDSLTRLLNHRGMARRMERQLAHAARSGEVFSLVMMDIDDFKFFNDAYGHIVGDRVLQAAARSLTATLRRSDTAARLGGDEFVAMLPGCDASAAAVLLERVRILLQTQGLALEGRSIPIRMSYGVATFPWDALGVAGLMAVADANLYRSKGKGGDCVTVCGADQKRDLDSLGSFTVLDGLVTTVDIKDNYTRRHSQDVTEFSAALAGKLGLSPDSQRSLRIAGMLHDVGKVGVPDQILCKPATLSDEELMAIKQHVTVGELIVKGIPDQEDVLAAIGTHHERWDGTGYPRGLEGENIPVLGRILAVTDAYSAMLRNRPYRPALSPAQAAAELERVAGSQLDPDMVSTFLELLREKPETGMNLGALHADLTPRLAP